MTTAWTRVDEHEIELSNTRTRPDDRPARRLPPEPVPGFPSCERCGFQHITRLANAKWAQSCVAHRRGVRPWEPCGKSPVPGSATCDLHGGKANPEVETRARRRRRQRNIAMAAVQTYGLPVDANPTEALMAEVRFTLGHVSWLRAVVASLDPDEVVWGPAQETDFGTDEKQRTEVVRRAAPNIWVQLYMAERKHLVEVCGTAIKAGLDERVVKLREAEAELIANVFRKLIADPELALTPDQREVARRLAASGLRALSGGLEGPA
jgi:hypothetical protein